MKPIPHMTYQQYRTARKLVHPCNIVVTVKSNNV